MLLTSKGIVNPIRAFLSYRDDPSRRNKHAFSRQSTRKKLPGGAPPGFAHLWSITLTRVKSRAVRYQAVDQSGFPVEANWRDNLAGEIEIWNSMM